MSTDATADTTAAPTVPTLAHDPEWPRTGGWAEPSATDAAFDLAVVGIPTSGTSLSPSNAHETPAAIRAALRRYSGHVAAPGTPNASAADGADSEDRIDYEAHAGHETQLVIDEVLRIVDAGDVVNPDTEEGEIAATAIVAALAARSGLVVALGGDNALTVPAMLGIAGSGTAHDTLATAGLITLDAHHDLRDGRSNGSPVRRLVEAGLDPRRIVQIGIADFANSRVYRDRARDWGITVIHRDELHDRPLREIVSEALDIAGAAGGPVHVDLDVDVCDRSVAPGCPASIPGGIQAHELRRITRLLAADPRVHGFDLAEVDATADAPDGRTVRLAALCILEAAAGLAQRLGR